MADTSAIGCRRNGQAPRPRHEVATIFHKRKRTLATIRSVIADLLKIDTGSVASRLSMPERQPELQGDWMGMVHQDT